MAVSANTIKHILTRYNSAVKAPNKIKNKYRKKIIGKKNKDIFKKESDDNNKFKKTSTDWLKSAGYLDAKDQDVISYIYVPPKKTEQNKISADAGHQIRSEIENVDLKKTDLASKIIAKKNNKKIQKPKKLYKVLHIALEEPTNAENIDRTDKIETLEDIVILQPGRNAQLAAKKISKKYKKIYLQIFWRNS